MSTASALESAPVASKTAERLRKLAVFVIYSIMSGIVLFVFILRPGLNVNVNRSYLNMVHGHADRPFVTRALIPTTIRLIDDWTPDVVADKLDSMMGGWSGSWKANNLMAAMHWEQGYLYAYAVGLTIFFLCILGYAYTLRYLINVFYDCEKIVADVVPLVSLIVLPLFFRSMSLPYDPGVWLLFTLGFALVATRKTALYYPVFVLAVLNKETAIVLVAIFVLREFGRSSKMRLWAHVLVQVAIWFGIRWALKVHFAPNPGNDVEFRLLDHNLLLWSQPAYLGHLLAVIAIFWLLIRYKWQVKPLFLRRSFLVVTVTLMGSTLFLGCLDELRDYYEIYPFLYLLVVPTVSDVYGLHWAARKEKLPKEAT